MDQLINAGQQFLNSQGNGQQQQHQQQQQQQQQQYQQGGNGGNSGGFDIGDLASLIGQAQHHDQNNSGNEQLFGQVASFLQNKQGNVSGDIDENALLQNHQQVNNSNQTVNSNQIGGAAALSAIQSVLGGSGGGGSQQNFQQKLIGAAMAHAGTLFDQKAAAGQAQGDKQDAMQQAGEAVMKLMIKNQISGMIGGGNSGGLGNLSSLLKLVG